LTASTFSDRCLTPRGKLALNSHPFDTTSLESERPILTGV
jgi:hypothetical protein